MRRWEQVCDFTNPQNACFLIRNVKHLNEYFSFNNNYREDCTDRSEYVEWSRQLSRNEGSVIAERGKGQSKTEGFDLTGKIAQNRAKCQTFVEETAKDGFV